MNDEVSVPGRRKNANDKLRARLTRRQPTRRQASRYCHLSFGAWRSYLWGTEKIERTENRRPLMDACLIVAAAAQLLLTQRRKDPFFDWTST